MDAAPTSPPATETSSLTDRLTGVITGPGEVFAEIRDAPVRVSNWLVPLILAGMATAIYIAIAFSQPAVLSGIQDQRAKAMQKQVAAGKMTQAQADQANAMFEQLMTPTVTKILSVGGGLLSSVAGLFSMGVIVWLLLRFCAGATVSCMKVVEICGLALVIDVPQKILRSFLVLWKDNLMATASPTLFLANPSTTNRTDVVLSMFDVVDIWWLVVLTIGLNKAAGVSYRTGGFIAFGVWFGFRILMVLFVPAQN
jgi:hypothetical protein